MHDDTELFNRCLRQARMLINKKYPVQFKDEEAFAEHLYKIQIQKKGDRSHP